MTNRKKAGRSKSRKSGSTPEKPTRKSHRRSRRHQKSDSSSPEADDSGSDDTKLIRNTDVSENVSESKSDKGKGEGISDLTKQVHVSIDEEEQKKGEESASSGDGSWKVKRENSEGGGIPKLKLCLQRPNDSSPVSDQLPSPRRRPRSSRGNVSPAKVELAEETHETRQSSRRSARNMKEVVVEPAEVPEDKSNLEDKEETASEVPVVEEAQTENVVEPEVGNEPETVVEEVSMTEEQQDQIEFKETVTEPEEVEIEQVENGDDETLLAVAFIVEDQERNEQIQSVVENAIIVQEVEDEDEGENFVVQYEDECVELVTHESELQTDEAVSEEVSKEVSVETPAVTEVEEKDEVVKEDEGDKVEEEQQQEQQPSRDSSEERAKEEALKSRKKKKKKEEELVEAEVAEDPGKYETQSNTVPVESVEKAEPDVKHISVAEVNETAGEAKTEQKPPVVRKRRWGSSSLTKTSKKPLVSISTDMLKEIIPEVKPLPLNEVQMSEDEEVQHEVIDSRRSSSKSEDVSTRRVKENLLQSDESEKDYEEEFVDESGVDEQENVEPVNDVSVDKTKLDREPEVLTRKVSVVSESSKKSERSPSPAINAVSNILYITNLVRPFTIPQLRDLLARTGTLVEQGFWIDKIKSKCFVQYETEDEAKMTRHALHGVRWPVSNPKQLIVDYGTLHDLKSAQEGIEPIVKKSVPSLFERKTEGKENNEGKDSARGNSKRDGERDRTRTREKVKDERSEEGKYKREKEKHRSESRDESNRDKKQKPQVELLVRDRPTRRVTVPVREWDVGKAEAGFSPPHDLLLHRHDRKTDRNKDGDDYDDYRRRDRDRDRNRRSYSGEPPRKSKKKGEEETPCKLLDDLFRKTKATPCIYWLPLTAEQIAVKEEMRRKHMAEHEKKVAEIRKKQREQQKRNTDRRRRRSKSHSRSRSPRK